MIKINKLHEMYDKKVVRKTLEFISTQSTEEIKRRRNYYSRELNKDQFISPNKIAKMRCFIHLTTDQN